MRIVWLIVGLASLVLGGLGVVLPLLPTTPFVILAALCFARSSPALHDRLLDSRTFGKAIRDWRTHRAISRKGKTASVLAMALSLAASLVLAVDLAVVGLQALAASAAAAFILTRHLGIGRRRATTTSASTRRCKTSPWPGRRSTPLGRRR